MLTRPFPGITFQAEVPTTTALPRMDIAAFVGFARQGPLNSPVVVESYLDFVDVFGNRYSLAWDTVVRLQQTACLAPCVKSFFAQGGRRCWIVRVAQAATAETAVFSLSGLLKTTASGYVPLSAQARSPGSWADRLQIKAELLVSRQSFISATVEAGTEAAVHLPLSEAQFLQPGDLLQLDFQDQRHRAYVAVPSAWKPADFSLLKNQKVYWFHRPLVAASDLEGTVQVPGSAAAVPGRIVLAADKTATLQITRPSAVSVKAGDWLQFKHADKTLWLMASLAIEATEQINLSNVWVEGIDSGDRNLTVDSVRHVQVVLRSKTTDVSVESYVAGSPHCDKATLASLSDAASHSSFPFEVPLLADEIVIPLGLDTAMPWRSAQISNEPALVRDGLAPKGKDYTQLTQQDWQDFMVDVFLDPALSRVGQRSLMTEASDRLYLQSKSLTGIHSLLPIDEISIVAIPDAAHSGWKFSEHQSISVIEEEESEPLLDRCHKSELFDDCQKPDEEANVEESAQVVNPSPNMDWQLLPSEATVSDGLLAVQSAIAQLAAARGDAIAILGLPKDYKSTRHAPLSAAAIASTPYQWRNHRQLCRALLSVAN